MHDHLSHDRLIWRALPENAVEKSKTDKSDKKDKTQELIRAQPGHDLQQQAGLKVISRCMWGQAPPQEAVDDPKFHRASG